MKATLGHIQVNVDFSHIAFYTDLMKLFGWSELYADDAMAGYMGEGDVSIWFSQAPEVGTHNPSAMGLSHIGIKVENQDQVDEAVEYLKSHDIAPLHNTPAHRTEFAAGDDQTYYQVIFESPDKILFEVLYAGPK